MSLKTYPLVRDWLEVSRGKLVLRTGKVDIGQRISTALLRIAAEELTLSSDQMEVAPVRTGASPDEGITSGSNSIQQTGKAQRLACATARIEIMQRAADILGCNLEDVRLGDATLSCRSSNEILQPLDLLVQLPADLVVDPNACLRAQTMPLPGSTPRGLIEMVQGKYTYIHDIERKDMLHARIICPPRIDAKLVQLDEAIMTRLDASGIEIIRDGSFLAVAGTVEWTVVQAAVRLGFGCRWETDAPLEHGDIFDIMSQRDAHRIPVQNGTPDPKLAVPKDLQSPDYAARFERPYTMHAALAPSAALAEFSNGQLEILTHSQGVYPLRDSIADSFDMAVGDVLLEFVPSSGCYGHNCADDAAFEAAIIARAIPDTPILLKYSRTDEHRREPLGTAMVVSIQSQVTENGRLKSALIETRGDTHRGRPRSGPNRAGPARLAANIARDCDVPRFVPEPNLNRHAGLHRNLDPIYDIPDLRLIKALVPDLPLRPSALRCLGAPCNIFAIESMIDNLAQACDYDPIAYRIQSMSDPRGQAVLTRLHKILQEKSKPTDGSGRGIAYAQYKNAMTRVAVAVDLSVKDCGSVQISSVQLVADAGRIIDGSGLTAQLEGGVLQGASWALYEKVEWGPDGRESNDWDSYPVLRFNDVPEISIEMIEPEGEQAVGAGEASPAPTVAAIANAIYAATGLRLCRLPFDRDAVMRAALQS
ncbi:MAG: molybdopterin cofactor-binding domain-containing protein [Roseobacter sp.]